MSQNSRPLKWHGGKQYLADWILGHFPPRDSYTHYCEPFAGGLALLFAHNPDGKSEAVNDINCELTNFWRTLQRKPSELFRMLSVTPLSGLEWTKSHHTHGATDIEKAVRFFVRYRQSRQGLGKSYCTPTKRTRRGMNENVSAWLSAVDGLPEAVERLRRVEIRGVDALEFIRTYDHPRAVFYCDPPYVHSSRSVTKAYEHEMSDAEHERLLDVLSKIKGRFLLSGYECEMYRQAAEKYGWRMESKQIDNKSSAAKVKETKTERLWMNYFHSR